MDGGSKGWPQWRDQALEQVRFRPDRWAIGQELTAHYEDHCRDLERVGYERSLAEERALTAMGDPEAVGMALDRAHKPWLGWLWEGSRALILLLVLLILGTAAFSGYGWGSFRYWTLFSGWEDPDPYAGFDAEELACPAPIQAGAYTITVDRARYWVTETGQGNLILQVTCTTGQFWLEGPDLYDTLKAVDSNGTLYRYGWFPGKIIGFNDDSHILSQGSIRVERISDQPEWVEITQPMGDWSLRVELPGKGAEA